MMKTKMPALASFMFLFVFLSSHQAYSEQGWGTQPGYEKTGKTPYELIGETLSKFSSTDAYVVGIGYSTQADIVKAKRIARDKAYLDAYSKLAELINGVYVKSGELQVITETEAYKQNIKAKVEGFAKGGKEVAEIWAPAPKAYYVVIYVPDFKNTMKKKFGVDVIWEEIGGKDPLAKAIGIGPCGSKQCEGLDLIKARELAYLDARKKLLEKLKGILIDMYAESEIDKEDIQLKIKKIEGKLEGLLKGARVLGENVDDDGSYTIELAVYEKTITDAMAAAVGMRPKKK